jgi:hypothetical protein
MNLRNPQSSKQGSKKESKEQGQEQEGENHPAVAEHGPAHKVVISHDESTNQHTVVSHHKDGHMHKSSHDAAHKAHHEAKRLAAVKDEQDTRREASNQRRRRRRQRRLQHAQLRLMPFKSKAQQKFAYANPDKFGGKQGLAEWSSATDFKALPERKRKAPGLGRKKVSRG